MSAKFEPGTVISALLDGNPIVGIVRGGGRRVFYADSVTTDAVDIKHLTAARPLVVIDPEDRVQVERLMDGVTWLFSSADVDTVQAALREFANPTPPKPEEPTGLGAVVEVSSGERYVRLFGTPGYYVWRSEVDLDRGTRSQYSDLDVVRVLSEGVTP